MLLAVPFALFGALFANRPRGLENDVYFEIGLVSCSGSLCPNSAISLGTGSPGHLDTELCGFSFVDVRVSNSACP